MKYETRGIEFPILLKIQGLNCFFHKRKKEKRRKGGWFSDNIPREN
jgi:hypothetical protein